jgi:hypothetical protein
VVVQYAHENVPYWLEGIAQFIKEGRRDKALGKPGGLGDRLSVHPHPMGVNSDAAESPTDPPTA